MTTEQIPMGRMFIDDEMRSSTLRILNSGYWIKGPESKAFGLEWAEYCGALGGVPCSNGSVALIAALHTLGIGPGDEVIVPSHTYIASATCISMVGATPIFVEIEEEFYTLDIESVKEALTPRTKCIIAVHLYGQPIDSEIFTLAQDAGIFVIEDAAQAHGASLNGKQIGSFGDIATLSFYPAHHITTGEGGMVSSNVKAIVDLARSFAWWGRGCYCVGQQNLLSNGVCGRRFDKWLEKYHDIVDHKYVFGNMGYNLKPLDMQGAVGSVQLLKYEEIHDKRRSNKNKLHRILERVPGVRVMSEQKNAETSWFGVPVLCGSKDLKHSLVKHFEDNKIQTRNYFAGNILLHPGYSHLDDANKYPNANQVLDLVFFLGCSPTINDSMIDYIEKITNKFINA